MPCWCFMCYLFMMLSSCGHHLYPLKGNRTKELIILVKFSSVTTVDFWIINMQGALHTQAFLSVSIKTDMLYLHEVCNCFRSIKHTINWIKTHKTKQAYFLWFFFTLLRQITQGLSITDWSLKYAILIYQLKAIRLGIHILLLQRLLSIYFAHNGIWNNANNEEKGPQVQWQLTLLFSPPGSNGWSVWGGAGLAWPGLA